MSQVAPNPREALEATPRRSLGKSRRDRIIDRQDGHCAYPECAVTTGLEIDHVIALELGGKDDDSNLQGLCPEHHRQKTNLDLKLISKSRRLRLKHGDPANRPPPTQKIRSAGFRKRWEG